MTAWLIDKSAMARIGSGPDASEWASRIQRGRVRISTLTRLEIGFSARSAEELLRSSAEPPLGSMPVEYLTTAVEDRAVAVQLSLARVGHHRAPSVPDLLIAASAELAGLTVLHVDKDFELIAEVTGQAVERLAIEHAS